MKKNLFVTLTISMMVICLVLAGCNKSSGSAAKNGVVLHLSSTVSEEHPTVIAYHLFADDVKRISNDEITVEVFANSSLGEQRDSIEGMINDTIELVHCNSGPLAQFAAELDFFNLPYVFRDSNHIMQVMASDIKDKDVVRIIDEAGFVYLSWIYGGIRSVMTKSKPIYSPADLRGLKIRVQPSELMVNSLNAMGAIATPMGQGEVYSAIQQGVLDGWENSPPTCYALKLHEVAPYISYTKHFITPEFLLMSKQSWNRCTPEQQKAIREAAAILQQKQLELMFAYEAKIADVLTTEGAKFNDVDTAPFRESVRPIWASYISKYGSRIIDEIQAK